jgi:hypothetical protein
MGRPPVGESRVTGNTRGTGRGPPTLLTGASDMTFVGRLRKAGNNVWFARAGKVDEPSDRVGRKAGSWVGREAAVECCG